MKRHDVFVDAEGTRLAAWFYEPEASGPGPLPAVVMAHGLAGVKELNLDRFARTFAEAGLAVLVFDHRNFGESEGTPRQEVDPWAQVRDYRHALTWLEAHPGVDPERLAVWGTSYSGGHVLVVAAVDDRVRCVVSQVPAITGSGARSRLPGETASALAAAFAADRRSRFSGGRPMTLQAYPLDATKPSAMRGVEVLEHHRLSQLESPAPTWQNEVTVRSLEMASEYEPGSYVERIAPRPLLMVVAEKDLVTPADFALDAYGRAGVGKELCVIKGAGHFDVYRGSHFETAVAAETCFLQKALLRQSRPENG